jgi:hypothetical protein
LQSELKDQKMVELEITQAIATRLTEWAKLLGYFVVVPLAVFAFILGLLGWHTFSDVEKTLSHATAEVQKAQQQAEDVKDKSEGLEHTYNQLSSDLTKYSQLDQRVQSLQNQVTQIQNHFTGVANVTPGAMQRLDADLTRLQSCISKDGHPAGGKFDVVIEPDDYAPMHGATAFFDVVNKRALIKASKTSDSSALLGEYMVSVRIPNGYPKEMSQQYQAVHFALKTYFQASCMNASPPADDSPPWSTTEQFDGGSKKYASMLWEVRVRIGSSALDKPLL